MWFDPKNEQGVILLFGYMASGECFDRFSIESIGTEFPDATIKIDGVLVRVEFEYQASNFVQHNHDVRRCDLVICWENDAPDGFPLPVIALKDNDDSIIVPGWYADQKDKELWYWKHRAESAERETNRLRNIVKSISEVNSEEIEISSDISKLIEIAGYSMEELASFDKYQRQNVLKRVVSIVPETSQEMLGQLFGKSTRTIRTDIKSLNV